jgi:hypothetical protein
MSCPHQERDEAPIKKPDLAFKPIAVGVHVVPDSGHGVIIAQGGGSNGFSLYLKDGIPKFVIRVDGNLRRVAATRPLAMGKPAHVIGMLDDKGKLQLFVISCVQQVPWANVRVLQKRHGQDARGTR